LIIHVFDDITEEVGNEFQIVQASNGLEALDIAEKEEITLVITDIMMPKMTGLEFIAKVRSKAEITHLPIIVVTAFSSDVDGPFDGRTFFMSKPFEFKILRSYIIMALKTHGQKAA